MRILRFGALSVLLLCIPALASARSRSALGVEAGIRFDGVFFPYAVEGVSLPIEQTAERKECSCWRAFGAFAGGTGGFLGYMPFALSDSRIGVSDTQRLLEWSAVTVGTAYLGYWIGKKFDRK